MTSSNQPEGGPHDWVSEPTRTSKEYIDSEDQCRKQDLLDQSHHVGNGNEDQIHSLQQQECQDTEKSIARVETNDVPYSVFSSREKKVILLAASTGALISPLTSNIYFPALNTLADDLNVSISQINLSITTYMVRAPFKLPSCNGLLFSRFFKLLLPHLSVGLQILLDDDPHT